MEYKKVGKYGLKVSAMSLGSWLTYGETIDQEKSKEIIYAAYDSGITSFDTANAYNGGEAEAVLGKILKDFRRETYVIGTKLFFAMGDTPNESGSSRKAVVEQVNNSLQRLQTDYVDILYFHRYDEETPIYETLRAIDDMIRQGKVLYYGVSEWTAKQITDALHTADKYLLDRMIVNQPSYNLLNRYIEKEVLPLCKEQGVGQIVFSPLAQGMLTGKYQDAEAVPKGSRADTAQGQWLRDEYFSAENFRKIGELAKLSEEAGIPMARLALAWNLSVDGISSVILGASRKEQILENIKALDVNLTEDMKKRINEICPIG